MKTNDSKGKLFRQLSDEELKQVTGGAGIDCSLPENKDTERCNMQIRREMIEYGMWGIN